MILGGCLLAHFDCAISFYFVFKDDLVNHPDNRRSHIHILLNVLNTQNADQN